VANITHNNKLIYSIWFTMSAGCILQFQSQQAIVAHLVMQPPLKLLIDLSVIVLWILAFVPVTYNSKESANYYWQNFLGIVIVIVLVFDVRVVWGFSSGVDIPILRLKIATEEEIVKIELDDEPEEPISELGLEITE
jgi:hypothetical protein